MNVNQVYALVNNINKQMYGADAVDVQDAKGLIALGNTVMSGTVDAFFKVLIDRIGKVIVRKLDLELEFPKLMLNDYEWGCAIQKITVDPFEATENSTWEISNVGFTPTLLEGQDPVIHATYFTDAITWEIKKRFPSEETLFTAFSSPQAFGAFAEAVTQAWIDSMTISVNNTARLAINNFIAEKIKNANGVINIADMYNAIAATPVTSAKDALANKDFLAYSTKIIRTYLKYIAMPNTNYNVDGRVRATQRDNLHFFALTEWIASLDLMQAGTWHTEYTDIYNYQEVGYWQGNKDSGGINDLDTLSAIQITPSSEKGELSPTDVKQSGIIAVMADRQAIFTGINKRRSSTFYDPIDDYTIMKSEATIQYCNDLSENGLVFIAEPTPNPGP